VFRVVISAHGRQYWAMTSKVYEADVAGFLHQTAVSHLYGEEVCLHECLEFKPRVARLLRQKNFGV
jgi:hypothetical protein